MTRPRKVQWADEEPSVENSSSSSSSSSSTSSSTNNNNNQQSQQPRRQLVRVRQFSNFAEGLEYEPRLPVETLSKAKRTQRFDRNLSTVKEEDDFENHESTREQP